LIHCLNHHDKHEKFTFASRLLALQLSELTTPPQRGTPPQERNFITYQSFNRNRHPFFFANIARFARKDKKPLLNERGLYSF